MKYIRLVTAVALALTAAAEQTDYSCMCSAGGDWDPSHPTPLDGGMTCGVMITRAESMAGSNLDGVDTCQERLQIMSRTAFCEVRPPLIECWS